MTTVASMRPFTTVSLADRAARVMRVQKFDRRAEDWLDINPPHEMTATLLAARGCGTARRWPASSRPRRSVPTVRFDFARLRSSDAAVPCP